MVMHNKIKQTLQEPLSL